MRKPVPTARSTASRAAPWLPVLRSAAQAPARFATPATRPYASATESDELNGVPRSGFRWDRDGGRPP